MSIKGKPLDVDYLIRRYESGESLSSLAKECGVCLDYVRKHLIRAGIKLRTMGESHKTSGRKKRAAFLPEVVSRYNSGESVKSIAAHLGRSCLFVNCVLKDAGITPRGRSDAELLKWKRLKTDRMLVERQCGRAWDAVRGSTPSEEVQEKKALARFRSKIFVFKGENEIADFVRESGFPVQQQWPVGPYNLDIAIDGTPVAVEVVHLSAFDFAGRGETGNRPQHERLKYLLDRGWFVIYLIATGHGKHRRIDLSIIGDDLIAWIERARSDESVFGKYRVIWGKGEAPPSARYDFNNLPAVA